jgi:hypothetical protein
MGGYEALAAFYLKVWWWLAACTVSAVFIFVRLMAGKAWAQGGMKLLFMLNALVIAWMFFAGVVSPGLAGTPPSLVSPQLVSHVLTFLYLLVALFWLLDAFLSRTPLVLPQRPRSRVQIIVGCGLALLFPLYELVGMNVFPRAEAFGAGPAPFVLFSIVLLGGSRPDTWVGKVLLLLTAALALDAGVLDAVYGGHWHHLLVPVIAGTAVVYGLRRRRMISLSAR